MLPPFGNNESWRGLLYCHSAVIGAWPGSPYRSIYTNPDEASHWVDTNRVIGDRSRLAPAWDDISYVTATVVDRAGVPVPDSADLISFKLEGPGIIAAVENGDNSSHEPFHATERHAFQGRCLAIIRARARSGGITITASAPNLVTSSVSIETVSLD